MSNLVRYKPTASALTGARKRVSVEEVREKYTCIKGTGTRILLLFDATGSMTPYWNEAQRTIGEIIERTLAVASEVTMKIVAYRDDDHGEKVLEPSPWSQRAEDLKDFLKTIQCIYGCDDPEAVDRALHIALEEDQVSRVILIGDSPPHRHRDCTKEGRDLGLKKRPVYAIVVGENQQTHYAFQTIATLSGGKLIPLRNLDELFDFITILSVDAAGADALLKYQKQYQYALTDGGRRLLLTLLK